MEHSPILDRVAHAARAAMMVHALKTSRVGLVGQPLSLIHIFFILFLKTFEK